MNEDDTTCSDASEAQILAWKTLIYLVKPNCVLYQKNLKGYSKKTDKMLMCKNIGALVEPPMTVDAEKEFYRLRQKFGKERRTVIQSHARSGAGADHIRYKSNWELYDDLMFLADHIQLRRSTSNYQQPMHQKVSTSQTSQLATGTSSKYQCTPTSSLTSNKSLDLWNNDLYESLDGSECINIENENLSSTVNSLADSVKSTSVPLQLLSTKSSTSSNNPSTSMLKAMASTIVLQKKVLLADKKKRKSTDEVDVEMLESSKNISSLASTLKTALQTTTSQHVVMSKLTPTVQGMMSSIAVGLSKVPEEYQMDCLISSLSCINTFTKK